MGHKLVGAGQAGGHHGDERINEPWRGEGQKSAAEPVLWEEAQLVLDVTEGHVWVSAPNVARGRVDVCGQGPGLCL